MEKALNRMLFVAAMCIAVLFVSGFIGGPKFDTSYMAYHVVSGDTAWAIASRHYDEATAGTNMCFEEYLWNVKHENEAKFANGRMLQPGDTLQIPYFVVVK